jgi:hypothetical protein
MSNVTNDTVIMTACIFAILTLNTLVFLYNMNPIVTGENFNFVDTSPSSFETGVNDTGIAESSTGLIAVINIVKFFINIIVLLFGWYPSYSPLLNLFIKLGTYTFAIPLFITIVRLIRGV